MSDDALNKLIKGFESFRKENYELNPERMQDLVENGQKPSTLVISCCDSRSSPDMFLTAEPGEIFVGRQIAALIPPFDEKDLDDTVAASIEYAVDHLHVEDIIVIGHSCCGGIEALAKDVTEGAVGQWIQRAAEIIERVENKHGVQQSHDQLVEEMERESILWSLDNLSGYPSVEKAVKDGKLRLHGWQFEMKKGELRGYDPKTKTFSPLAPEDQAQAASAQKRHHLGYKK